MRLVKVEALELLRSLTSPGPAASFSVYDGTELSQAATANEAGFELGVVPGAVFGLGVDFEVLGLDAAPTSVSDEGGAIDALAPAALAAVERGWAYVDGILVIRVEAGSHTIVVDP